MNDTSKATTGADTAAEFDKIREDIAALKADLARLGKDLANTARGEISEESRRLYAKLAERGDRSVRAVSREIEERPLTVLLLAFGIGFISGSLLRR